MVRRLCAAVVPLLLLCLAVPGIAQQPTPAQPQPPPAVETPEAEASRDLERIGEVATQKKAADKLESAFKAAYGLTKKRRRQSGGWVRDCRSDDPEIQDLRDAVRYYARAHGLPPNVDELTDEMETFLGILAESTFLRRAGDGRDKDIGNRWGQGILTMKSALFLLRDIKACEATFPAPPRTVGSADPPRDTGLSRNARIGIVAGAGAVLVGVLAGGGSETPGVAIAPAPPPPLSPFDPAGTYDVTLSVRADPGGNASRIGMEPALVLVFTVNGSNAQYTCPPGSHINPGSGPVDLVAGTFNFAGVGPFAGRPNVQFLFPGVFGRDGTISGEYRVGTGGELGEITTYAVSGRRRQ